LDDRGDLTVSKLIPRLGRNFRNFSRDFNNKAVGNRNEFISLLNAKQFKRSLLSVYTDSQLTVKFHTR